MPPLGTAGGVIPTEVSTNRWKATSEGAEATRWRTPRGRVLPSGAVASGTAPGRSLQPMGKVVGGRRPPHRAEQVVGLFEGASLGRQLGGARYAEICVVGEAGAVVDGAPAIGLGCIPRSRSTVDRSAAVAVAGGHDLGEP